VWPNCSAFNFNLKHKPLHFSLNGHLPWFTQSSGGFMDSLADKIFLQMQYVAIKKYVLK
jgi:hypothetical protein